MSCGGRTHSELPPRSVLPQRPEQPAPQTHDTRQHFFGRPRNCYPYARVRALSTPRRSYLSSNCIPIEFYSVAGGVTGTTTSVVPRGSLGTSTGGATGASAATGCTVSVGGVVEAAVTVVTAGVGSSADPHAKSETIVNARIRIVRMSTSAAQRGFSHSRPPVFNFTLLSCISRNVSALSQIVRAMQRLVSSSYR